MQYDNLTPDGVCLTRSADDTIYRSSLDNTVQGRLDLLTRGLDTAQINEIMEAWGDAPTVADPKRIPVTRDSKSAEIAAACKAAIYAGIELDGERFSLTEEDQINISTALKMIEGGAEHFPYHADGRLCEPFPAAKILALAEAATRHKIYHTTYCNHLNVWIRRADGTELESIRYGADLPPDLAAHMAALLGQ